MFSRHPAFEPSGETFQLHGALARKDKRYRLKPGASIGDVRFDNIFYADHAIKSYAVFAELKRQGVVPAHVKFQVDLVPAHSVIWLYVQEDLHPAVDTLFNDAVLREIDKIAAAIPHDQLAIQFDIASAVFARLERNQPTSYGKTKLEMQETFAGIVVRLANHVPADIDLMFHFCYGDAGHKHVVEPTDMGDMVEFANRLTARRHAADPAHPHAGAARPLRRRLFRAAEAAGAQAGDRALPRPRALHRWRRRDAAAPRHREEISQSVFDRDRMRIRPARSGNAG